LSLDHKSAFLEHKRASQCQENSKTQDIVAVSQVQDKRAPFSALFERSPMSEKRYGVISGLRSAEDQQLAIARL
jgi:ethanolamine utilization protein EutP (predicted NTPase)